MPHRKFEYSSEQPPFKKLWIRACQYHHTCMYLVMSFVHHYDRTLFIRR